MKIVTFEMSEEEHEEYCKMCSDYKVSRQKIPYDAAMTAVTKWKLGKVAKK